MSAGEISRRYIEGSSSRKRGRPPGMRSIPTYNDDEDELFAEEGEWIGIPTSQIATQLSC